MSERSRFTRSSLVTKNLTYYRRTNLAVVAAVAIAIGVLTGALVVGDSVRGSLRELFLGRLGATDSVVLANSFFREALADSIAERAVPVIAFEGMVTAERSGRRRARVQVYGVDERFWRFHGGEPPALGARDALLTARLREELEAEAGDTVLLRVETPSAVSRESLHGEKENVGRTIRLTAAEGLEATGLPEFSLYPTQDEVAAIFVPLARLQRDLGQPDRVNTVLVGGETPRALPVTLDDVGVSLRAVDGGDRVAVESAALMLADPVVEAVTSIAVASGAATSSFFTYLANTFRVDDSETPYSLVTGVDEVTYRALGGQRDDGVVLNAWLAEDLGAAPGDSLWMDFYVWSDDATIETHEATFTVEAVVPMEGLAADRDLAPDYPGISETENLSDWEPPFPLDLRRVRDEDEAYWDDYRATPKAFVPLSRAQSLWPVRQGRLTSIRLAEAPSDFDERLLARLDPLELGFTVTPVREQGLEASTGATDFGEYFFYFSYFLVVAALLLSGLFFKLGVEQRHREIGTLLATGYSVADVRRLFLAEGVLLSVLGGALGLVVALGYAGVILVGLRTFWVDAVGTRLLTLSVEPLTLAAGLVLGMLSAVAATWLTLRSLSKVPARRLLSGDVGTERRSRRSPRRALLFGSASSVLAVAFVVAAAFGLVPDVVGFFGAGNLLLLALLVFEWAWLERGGARRAALGLASVAGLGARNASHRPGRSLVVIALIAFATFIIVAVDAFRKSDDGLDVSRHSGGGGYTLAAESLLPLHWNPNTDEGRDAFNLPYPSDSDAVPMTFRAFRLRPGDDASCLNLYRPQNPRVLAASSDFIAEGRFRFAASLAETPEEEANPWLLLERRFDDGAVPVIGDQNSMSYVLHLGLGEDFELARTGREPLTLRLVATLSDSLFQGELLMDEAAFVEHFPGVDGFRYFLIETEVSDRVAAEELLETRLADFGFDVTSTAAKIARFHRVENTYLSTFQSLGGLGLVLGTFGLGAVLLRNVLERRKELALLRAVGFRREDFRWMILAENALLLGLGLMTGTLSAVVAIAPAFLERGGRFDGGSLALLLAAVIAAGLLSSAVGLSAASRAPLLASLRAE